MISLCIYSYELRVEYVFSYCTIFKNYFRICIEPTIYSQLLTQSICFSGTLFSELKPATADQLADEFLRVLSRRTKLSRAALSAHTFAEFERAHKEQCASSPTSSLLTHTLRADWQSTLRGALALGVGSRSATKEETPANGLLGIGLGLDEEVEKALGAEVGQWGAHLLLDYVAGVVPLAEVEKRLAQATSASSSSPRHQSALDRTKAMLAARAAHVEKALREPREPFHLDERVRC